MDKYVLHFFKEQTRKFDFEQMLSFFDEIAETKEDENNNEHSKEFKILYNNPILSSKAEFIFSNKSAVRDLHRLNPRFLDVNMRVEIPIITTSYAASFIFEIVKKLTEEFNFYVYNDLFKDIIELRMPTVIRSFELTKENFKEKYNYLLEDIYYCPKDKLNDVLKYVNEQYSLQRYYRDQEIYVPNYHIVVDEDNKIYFAMHWQEGKLTVFPPHLDYVYYNTNNATKTTIIPYYELIAKIEKLTTNVPGFLENTKVIENKKNNRRVIKTLKKAKFTNVEKNLKRINLNQIIDF